jgi:hypothetical protein
MDKPPVHWILDLVPLMALLIVSGFMYAYRYRRVARFQTRPQRRAPGPALSEFWSRCEEMANFRRSTGADAANGDAWNNLHARLSALSELEHQRLFTLCEQDVRALSSHDRRGGVHVLESYRGAGAHESKRFATDHGDVR